MSTNGHPPYEPEPEAPKSTVGEMLSLLEDQMDLAALEWDFEKKHNVRRFGAIAGAVVLFLSAFVVLQAAAILGLVALGLGPGWACLALAGLELLVGGLLLSAMGKRDPKVGEPFKGTRQEFRKNIQWIRQILS